MTVAELSVWELYGVVVIANAATAVIWSGFKDIADDKDTTWKQWLMLSLAAFFGVGLPAYYGLIALEIL